MGIAAHKEVRNDGRVGNTWSIRPSATAVNKSGFAPADAARASCPGLAALG
jgi:hypothetical protein